MHLIALDWQTIQITQAHRDEPDEPLLPSQRDEEGGTHPGRVQDSGGTPQGLTLLSRRPNYDPSGSRGQPGDVQAEIRGDRPAHWGQATGFDSEQFGTMPGKLLEIKGRRDRALGEWMAKNEALMNAEGIDSPFIFDFFARAIEVIAI